MKSGAGIQSNVAIHSRLPYDPTALKNSAPKARLRLIRVITDRVAFVGITPGRTLRMQETQDVILIGGRALPRVVGH